VYELMPGGSADEHLAYKVRPGGGRLLRAGWQGGRVVAQLLRLLLGRPFSSPCITGRKGLAVTRGVKLRSRGFCFWIPRPSLLGPLVALVLRPLFAPAVPRSRAARRWRGAAASAARRRRGPRWRTCTRRTRLLYTATSRCVCGVCVCVCVCVCVSWATVTSGHSHRVVKLL
jgi:hypothetical protein